MKVLHIPINTGLQFIYLRLAQVTFPILNGSLCLYMKVLLEQEENIKITKNTSIFSLQGPVL